MHVLLAAIPDAPQLGNLVPLWSVMPFAAMLLGIAILPLAAGRLWESNLNKALLSAVLGVPVAIWTATLDATALAHAASEYLSFILLLGALFVISGGIVVRGTLAGTPGLNSVLIAIGAVLASLVGTTGASMLLIRPLLRANSVRKWKVHVVVFFIFVVSNAGGLLTPLGDPPRRAPPQRERHRAPQRGLGGLGADGRQHVHRERHQLHGQGHPRAGRR